MILLSFPAAQRIVGLSSNFTIGFGSFVEKVVDPFTTLDPRYRNDPCFQDGCEATYSYRHVISLTNDSSRFNVSNIVECTCMAKYVDLQIQGPIIIVY